MRTKEDWKRINHETHERYQRISERIGAKRKEQIRHIVDITLARHSRHLLKGSSLAVRRRAVKAITLLIGDILNENNS